MWMVTVKREWERDEFLFISVSAVALRSMATSSRL